MKKIIYTLLFALVGLTTHAQIIYQHAFGTATFTPVNPYTVAPNIIDANMSGSQWASSFAPGFSSLGGSTGQALSLSNSSGTPTYSLSFTVAPGYTCGISSYSFWRQRSGTGAQNWTLTVNGSTLIGAGTTPTTGINTGTLAVTNPANGLSGTVNVVLQLGGATGTGSFRLDDFTLYGIVNPTVSCTPPTIQASSFTVSSIGSSSVTLNWTPGNGGNVIVLASLSTPVSASPASGNTYTASSTYGSGQQIGSGNYVVYNGTGSSAGVIGLIPGATYYFSVFEYNTSSSFPCYATPALTGSATIGACIPPTTQATSFTTTAVGTTSATINWLAGSGSNALVLVRSVSAVTGTPTSGNTYTAPSTVYGAGQQVGTGNYIVYDGTGTSVTVTNLNPGTTYYFSIFEFNVTAGSPCYLTPGLTGSLTPLATPIPTTCLQIKSILVDACQANATNYESYNEMVYFKNGPNPLPINQLSIAGAPASGVYALNKWPNNNNLWNGVVQTATTAANVAAINSSVLKCGFVLEPTLVAGIATIRPFANVILVGSQIMNPLTNSFANLTDTVYMIFQAASTTTGGNFVNWSSGTTGTRGLTLIDNANGCTSNTITYEPQLLLNHADGDAVSYNSNNTASYYNSGCQAPYIPLSVDAGADQTVCFNAISSLTATASGVYNSVSWSGGAGVFSSPTTLQTNYTPGGGELGSIKLYCTIVRSCATSTSTAKDSVYITNLQLPSPTINATNGYSLCPLASTILSYSLSNASATGTTSTAWSLPAATTSTYAVSAPTGTGAVTYTLSLTNFCGVATRTVNVYPLASPSITIAVPSLTACAGNTVVVSAMSNSGNYSWNNPAGATTTSVVLTANTTTTGIVTTTNTCGTKTDSYTLTVTQQPTVSISPSAVSLCTGQSATVTASANTAVTYTWSGTGVNGLNTNTVSLNTAGTYTVAASNVCNTSTAQVNVVVNSTPTLSVATTNSLLCGGATATLSLSGSTGTYSWSNGATTSTISINAAGTYTAMVTTSSCGTATASIVITAALIPSVSVNSNSITICTGQSATLTATSNISNYNWSTGATTNTISVNTASTYTIGSTNACGTSTQSIVVSIAATPTLSINTPSLTLCAGSTETLTLSGSTGTYAWSTGTATTSTLPITTGGVYSATVTTLGCGTATASVTIASLQMPTLTVASNTAIVCNNTPIILTATSTYTNNYSWLPLAASTNTLQVLTPLVYTVTSTNSCGSAMQTITVTIGSTPVLTVTPTSTVVCAGNTVSISATGGTGNYNWTGVSSTSSVVAVSSGTYIVSNTNACGTGSQTVIVNTSTVSAGLDGAPTSGTSPLGVSFSNLSVGATTYTWNYGNGTSSNGLFPIPQTYTAAGVYTVSLSVTNSNGCMDSQSILITVKNEDATLIVPNIFTPNNDSINDLFYVKATNIADFNCVIFDRWGLQFYSWSNLKGGWDGKTAGKDATDGTYFYIINATDTNGKDVKRQGSFLLIR